MDLWIRSQDKEKLVKCNDIVIRRFIDEDSLYSYQILGYFEKETEFEILGIYETKERVLEVLDEINNYKDKLEKAHFLGMAESEFVSSTFVMPKE